MFKKLTAWVISCLLLCSCGKTPSIGNPTGTGSSSTNGTSHRPPPPPSIVVKDQTRPPPLQAAIPAALAMGGFARTLTTPVAALPAVVPTPNTVFYTAKARIDNRDRTISVVFGDIVKESDTIVNAASGSLTGGGGVDGAIHKAAMEKGNAPLVQEAIAYKKLHNLDSFPTGTAMVTNAYGSLRPNIDMIVFTVGPQGASTPQNDLLLYSAVYDSLLKASEYGAKSVSIPAVSTGIYGFPLAVAATLFFKAALQFFNDHPTSSIDHIRFTNFDQPTVAAIATEFIRIFP